MGKIKRYNDKRPVPHALRPREHYTKKNGVWKAKMSFPDEMGANNYIRTHGENYPCQEAIFNKTYEPLNE